MGDGRTMKVSGLLQQMDWEEDELDGNGTHTHTHMPRD